MNGYPGKLIADMIIKFYQHSREMGHTFNFSDTKIIAAQPHLNKRIILESIYINKYTDTAINLKFDIDKLNPVFF